MIAGIPDYYNMYKHRQLCSPQIIFLLWTVAPRDLRVFHGCSFNFTGDVIKTFWLNFRLLHHSCANNEPAAARPPLPNTYQRKRAYSGKRDEKAGKMGKGNKVREEGIKIKRKHIGKGNEGQWERAKKRKKSGDYNTDCRRFLSLLFKAC